MASPKKKARKTPALRKKQFVALALVLLFVVLGIGLFLIRERLRKVYYGDKVSSGLSSQTAKLGQPLQSLGFKDIKQQPDSCIYGLEHGYSGNRLQCIDSVQSYQVLPTSTNKVKAEFMRSAYNLNTLLVKNGWHVENGSITPWFQNIVDGVDYQPDDFNYLQKGNMFCTLDFVTAFSKPKPPAIAVTMQCASPEVINFGS